MAAYVFAKARQHLASGGDVDWLNDDIKVVLVDHGTDAPDLANDEFLSAIGAGARVATSGNLASKAILATGALDAGDIEIATVSGATVESVVVYKDTGDAATSPLLSQHLGNFTPNGNNMYVRWDATGVITLTVTSP